MQRQDVGRAELESGLGRFDPVLSVGVKSTARTVLSVGECRDMSEITRTCVFVVVAAASMGLALTVAPSTDLKPTEIVAAKLGEQFYPDFKDPNEPTSLSVVTFNEKDATAKPFSVQFKDGLWTIPSHHNYPADGAERLAKTSASAIGIKREEIRSNSAEDHVELGVVDPLDQDGKKLKGRGQRITLKKGDSTVMDLIIGKQVRNRQGFYYVRKPDEKSTYVAKIDIDISTKFADWVETDLLKLDRDDLRAVSMNNYSIDEAAGRIVDGDVVELSREKSGEPWKLKGLEEKSEELETAKVNDLVNTLDDLKLSGIRPKPEGLSEDLKLNQGIQLDPVTAMDLRSRVTSSSRGNCSRTRGNSTLPPRKGWFTPCDSAKSLPVKTWRSKRGSRPTRKRRTPRRKMKRRTATPPRRTKRCRKGLRPTAICS